MTSPTPKADRFINRAPRGGMVSPINNRFYKGGQFMPMAIVEVVAAPARATKAAKVARIVAKADARIRRAEVEKRTLIHTAAGLVNREITPAQRARVNRLNRTIDRACLASRRATLGTIWA
jgi:hypothetical protein